VNITIETIKAVWNTKFIVTLYKDRSTHW